jgi:probable F420-dependent oxidoreductase
MASLDVVSGGRVLLGVGVGWMQEEFEVLGMPFDHRGKRSDEQLEVFETLFTDPHPSYDGTYYSFPPVGFEPKPVQSPMPIWVGGNTEAAYRRVARCGAAFHAAFEPLEDVRAAWARVQELVKAEGRDPGSVQLSIRLYLDPQGRMPPAKSVAGSTEQMVDTIGRWQEIGVSHILFDPVASGGQDGRTRAMESFMVDVAPSVR